MKKVPRCGVSKRLCELPAKMKMVLPLFRILGVVYELFLIPTFTSLVVNEVTEITDSTILIEQIIFIAPVVSPLC